LISAFEIQVQQLVPDYRKKRFLIAISGGLDSVVLAALCQQTELHFGFCHVNYHLRGEASNVDADFVSDLAVRLDVPMYLLENDLSDFEGNIQLEARESRYDWFYELLDTKPFDFVLTAHHLNDSIETLLFNLGRGTGIDGLLGIPAQNDKILRPLLSFTKQDILSFAKNQNLLHREDASNATDKYARNFLRHHVVPKLEEQNPSYLTGVHNTLTHLHGTAYFNEMALDMILDKALTEDDYGRWLLDWEQIKSYDYPSHILLHWLAEYGYTGKQIEDFLLLGSWNNGAKLLAKEFSLLYDRGQLILTPKKTPQDYKISFDPRIIGDIQFGDFEFQFSFHDVSEFEKPDSPNVAFFDVDKLSLLTLRFWEDGDSFSPFGMGRQVKKVRKLFTDAKYDVDQKRRTPLLLNGEDIIWVCGLRASEMYRVGEETRRVVRCEMF